jgi:hypothetical protein
MRLYEFTDPTDRTSCADDADDSIRKMERNGKAADAVPQSKSKPETGKTKPMDTVSNPGSVGSQVSGTHDHVHGFAWYVSGAK